MNLFGIPFVPLVVTLSLLATSMFMLDHIVYMSRDFTTFWLSLGRRYAERARYQRLIDGIDGFASTLDRIYNRMLRSNEREFREDLKNLEESIKKLKELANKKKGYWYNILPKKWAHKYPALLEDFQSHAVTMKDYVKYITNNKGIFSDVTKSADGVFICIGEHVPLIGIAFAALAPIFETFKADEETMRILGETSETIKLLMDEMTKVKKKLQKEKFQLNATELEEMSLWFKVLEDGIGRMTNVLNERQSGILNRFKNIGAHKESLESWNKSVEEMLKSQNRERLNIVYYRTRLILQMTFVEIGILILQLGLSLTIIFELRDIKNAILHPEKAFFLTQMLLGLGSFLKQHFQILTTSPGVFFRLLDPDNMLQ